jgi:lipopolysaccharide biosynthesis glycosyltransferase
MSKNLVYYTVGGDPDYVSLLKFGMATLREQCDMTDTDVMVMCDSAYYDNVKGIEGIDDIMVVKGENKNHIETSMRKTQIFDYSKIHEYDKVLYLDCDIIVLNDILSSMMPEVVDENKLYVLEESRDNKSHTIIYHGFCDYSDQQLQQFKENNIFVFNCGQFAFKVTEQMQDNFNNVCKLINARMNRKYYYEQSHMNYYFNTNSLTIPLLNRYAKLTSNVDGSIDIKKCSILHFAYGNVSFRNKLIKMKYAYDNKDNLNINDYVKTIDHTKLFMEKFNISRFLKI